MPSMGIQLIRAVLLFLSFSGLCAALHKGLKIHVFIAPYVAVSGIIICLMLGGMLRILEPVFWTLYIGGFLALIYALLVPPRKILRSQWALGIAAIVFIAFLVWRFYFCPLESNDDISHWALVARHLLRYDSFPDKTATYVFFQSYPLGMASFIYYICKTIANCDGMYLLAFNFLLAPLFLPVFALISPKRKSSYPVCIACFVLLFHFFRSMISLQVDITLAFFGIGMIASVAYYRNCPKYAFWTALPGMIAVVYIKNSGMFFAMMTAVCLAWNVCRTGGKRTSALKILIVSVAAFVAAYLIWVLHIRLSYPNALNSKHAISISAYAAEVIRKGGSTALQILKLLIRKLLEFTHSQDIALIFCLGCAGLIAYGCYGNASLRKELGKYWRALCLCALAYGIWFVMLCGMYLFSMPEQEALKAESFGDTTARA